MSGSAPPLELRDIAKSYGDLQVLRGFSALFAPGEVTAVVGSNGAGKTTLLRIVAGLQQADSGSVSGGQVLYYGGFETLPIRGTINRFRGALTLGPVERGSRRMSNLSRGELHQVGLDVALALGADALLLDEPWTALEPDAREALNDAIRAYADGGRVVVCSSHDLDEVARVADAVVFLSAGNPMWVRRDQLGAGFQRDELIRIYREGKRQ